jgi:hypothetical protein
MMDEFDEAFDPSLASRQRQAGVIAEGRSALDIPELVSRVYRQAPVPLRAKLLECLLRPVGPLALLAIAAGAFARFLYRLQRDAVPISLDDAARITSDHVLELARYVEQCSPEALLKFGSLIAGRPLGFATISGSALLMALSIWQRRLPAGTGGASSNRSA